MSFIIEYGVVGEEWRAIARADGEIVAEASGPDDVSAKRALMAVLGEANPSSGQEALSDPTPVADKSAGMQKVSNALRDAVRELLANHPEVLPHDGCTPRTAKMDRYRTRRGRSIAHEYDHSLQSIWVAAEGLPSELGSIRSNYYRGGSNGKGRHSNLQQMRDLKNADLVKFSPADVDQARAIIDAVAKLPPTIAGMGEG